MNIVTKTAPDEPEVSILTRPGSFGTKEMTAHGGGKFGELEIYAALKYIDTDGWNFSAVDGNGVAGSEHLEKNAKLLNLQPSIAALA